MSGTIQSSLEIRIHCGFAMAATLAPGNPTQADEARAELARLNRELRMLSRCNRALTRARREDDLLGEVCRLIVEVGGYPCVWVGYAEKDAERSIRPVAQVGIEADLLAGLKLSWADVPKGRGPSGRAIRERTPQISHDIRADPALAGYIVHADEHGYFSIISLPLITGDDCIGALAIVSARPNAFDESETTLLGELADDLAYGIGALRTQLDHELGQQDLRLFRALLDRTNDFIYAVDARTGRLLDANDALSRKLGYTRTELLQMSVPEFSLTAMVRPWADSVRRLRDEGTAVHEGHYRARDGALHPVEIGLTYVEQDSRPYVIVVSRDIGERQHQQARIERLTRVLRMQSAIGLAVLRINDRDELLQEACRVAVDLGGYDVAMVSIVDPDGRHARPHYRFGRPPRTAQPPIFDIGDGTTPDTSLTGLALRTGRVVVCDDLTQTELPVAARNALYQDGVRSLVALPLIVDGTKVGVLTMTSPVAGQVVAEELLLLQDITVILSFALRSQQQADTVRYLAYFDSVTGLAKRALFCERLDSLLSIRFAPEEALGVVAFCVDELGSINDRFGGNFGDLLLKEVAERLRHHADSDDRIGYLGGGTFVLAEPGLAASDESSGAVLDDAVFASPFSIEGRVIRVSGRAGVARHGPDGKDGDALVRNAEAALNRAREAGALYRPNPIEAHSEVSDRLALEHRLRRAIDARQFEVRYLPQLDLATGRIAAVEALLRWNDPEQGVVAPERFLPVLESSGLINPVGNWVLQRAIEDGIRWQALGIGPVRIAVNVSALQIRRRAFVDYCLEQLSRWRVRVGGYGIDLEVSEAALLQDVGGTSSKLSDLRAAGVRVALDNFGIGYSSLGLLSRLPVDLIKIDRSLIQGLPHDRVSGSLVTSIMGLASAFGLVTVAVGVSQPDQLKMLANLKCDEWQGYLCSPPVAIGEIERILQAGMTGVGGS
jgi:diguanylate cyclase (GGDEF)-like protein/PAS domain S-box-containing protein